MRRVNTNPPCPDCDKLLKALKIKRLLARLDGIYAEAQAKLLFGMIDTLQVENARLHNELLGAELFVIGDAERAAFAEARAALGEGEAKA